MDLEYRGIPFLYLRKNVCTSLIQTVCRIGIDNVQESAGATSIFGCYPQQIQDFLTLYEKTAGPLHPFECN